MQLTNFCLSAIRSLRSSSALAASTVFWERPFLLMIFRIFFRFRPATVESSPSLSSSSSSSSFWSTIINNGLLQALARRKFHKPSKFDTLSSSSAYKWALSRREVCQKRYKSGYLFAIFRWRLVAERSRPFWSYYVYQIILSERVHWNFMKWNPFISKLVWAERLAMLDLETLELGWLWFDILIQEVQHFYSLWYIYRFYHI